MFTNAFTWILQVHGAFNSKTGSVDPWQLHASRLGLIAQALLQLFTALFIIADVKRDIWKNRSVAVISIVFLFINVKRSQFSCLMSPRTGVLYF